MPTNPPQPVGTPDPVDFDRVADVSEGDTAFERKVLGVFVEDMAKRLDMLQKAVDANQTATVILEAHNIKGASGNLGVVALRNAAEACELAARGGDVAACVEALARMREEYQRASGAIQAHLGLAAR